MAEINTALVASVKLSLPNLSTAVQERRFGAA